MKISHTFYIFNFKSPTPSLQSDVALPTLCLIWSWPGAALLYCHVDVINWRQRKKGVKIIRLKPQKHFGCSRSPHAVLIKSCQVETTLPHKNWLRRRKPTELWNLRK